MPIDPMNESVFLFYGLMNNEEFIEKLESEMHGATKELDSIDLDHSDYLVQKRLSLYNFPEIDDIESGEYISYARSLLSFDENYIDDAKSFYLMLAFAASYPDVAQWILDNEASLFMKRYRFIMKYKMCSLPFGVRTPRIIEEIENKLFMNEIRRPNEKYDDEKSIPKKYRDILRANYRVKWYWVSNIAFNWEDCQIYGGWVILSPVKSQNVTKVYENIIEYVYKYICADFVESFKMHLSDEMKSQFKLFAIFSLSDKIKLHVFESKITEINAIMERSPMCIQSLLGRMRAVGIGGYWSALQMSFYLRQFVTEENLIRFFWENDVRNRVYASFESFKDDNQILMRWFHQIYTAKDYKPLGCKKARALGHCFYQANTPDRVLQILRDKYEKTTTLPKSSFEGILSDIERNLEQRKYWNACGLEMCLRLDRDVPEVRKLYGKKNLAINNAYFDYYATVEPNYEEHKKSEGDEKEGSDSSES